MELPPFQPFRLHIEVVSLFTTTENAVATHMRNRNFLNAKALLEGEWHSHENANITRTLSRRYSERRIFTLNLVDEMNSCLFHPDVLSAVAQAHAGERKVNLGWWQVPLHSHDGSTVLELRIDSNGTFFLVGLQSAIAALHV